VLTLSGGLGRFSYYILVDRDIPSLYSDWMSTGFPYKKAWRPVPVPAPDMFKGPVWSTWAQYLWNISQTTVLSLAHDIESEGLPYSILEIDDRWQRDWGDTAFDPVKFPDARAMIAQLHGMGFKVSLWVPPFVDNDSSNFNASTQRYFVQSKSGGVSLIDWWDTFGIKKAGLIDFGDQGSVDWWAGLLSGIVSGYGIDGFKFDAGEANWFPQDGVTSGYLSPNQYADFYISLHEHVPAMEFRAGWFSQDQGQIMREYDKDSVWGSDNGLKSVLTQMFALEMIGYPFVLPDMIGGNGYTGLPSSELYIRWMEMNAFMPLMQFSILPWNPDMGGVSTQTTVSIARFYAGTHQSLSTYIMGLARNSAQTGMPMVKPLFFDYPTDAATYTIDDEFLLGDTYLVCPVFNAGQTYRDVYLPAGTWTDYFTRGTFTGPVTLKSYPAPLQIIPVFIKQ
ncbi:MAG: glycoside hydrolase family 31 protein, partial [Deltaproteobacteria bacterium]|nr:glycoside hydrolase family 31 protein [Deltaproteobacteria bacterium]